jgi:hypothetical protein
MTRDAKKQSVKPQFINCLGHDWIKTDVYDTAITAASNQRIVCSLCGHFPTTSQFERADAIVRLKDWIKPGDTLYTEIKNVSRSGMSRVIQVIKINCNNGEPSLSYLGYSIALALDWKYDREREGVKVGGCGMDMGFHMIHTLGYVLYGRKAEHGTDKEAVKLRKALLKADTFYFTQGGQPEPDTTKPDRLWFGGAGYALKQRWI